jgi:hypothetical protein
MSKKNCWEFKNCGREQNGSNVEELGICPASIKEALDGVHDGMNAGRACWVVAGSMCDGKRQGTFSQKYNICMECDFYKTVKEEEGTNMEMSIILLNMIRINKAKVKE